MILALANRADPDHERVRSALSAQAGPYLVPAGLLAEVTFMLERDLGGDALVEFLAQMITGALLMDCGEEDLPRARELVVRYADFPLGFADAAVIACAERHGGAVLTLDHRHFGVVAREGHIRVLPSS